MRKSIPISMRKIKVETYLDKDTLARIDNLINKKLFDDRSSFLRRATIDKLNELDKPIRF